MYVRRLIGKSIKQKGYETGRKRICSPGQGAEEHDI